MTIDRRKFLTRCSAYGVGAWAAARGGISFSQANESVRNFHASISIDAFKNDPDLPKIVREAGITDVWVACFLQGQWHHSIEETIEWRNRLESEGLAVHNITVPFGHPSFTEKVPDYMPGVAANKWKPGIRPDGQKHYGVALHEGVTEANVEAVERIKTTNPGTIFLDDDFRLAPSPADIGGCFCEEHKQRFLKKHGLSEKDWASLLTAVQERDFNDLLRAWVGDICDDLTACFRAQQQAASPEAELGIMVMYLGSEKAGIRLEDYRESPFRVGELMFNDKSFAPVKGKTNELFSSLFHRRFVEPIRAYSETTAWPPDGLSAENMAAKLVISTLSDVRNTMFMSGNTPFPRTHWEVLAPAMRKNREIHQALAGHKPRGPFKHFWGEASRWAGDANPYSLFLALGVPFEVVEEIPEEGWTFLSDADARQISAGRVVASGSNLIYRPDSGVEIQEALPREEDLKTLFGWRKEILPELKGVPYVEEEEPVVCGWYPTAGAVLLWNLSETPKDLTVRFGEARRQARLAPLDFTLLTEMS
ncbi:MAG: hypothetical protein KC994_18360 [Candidatus Omnitrophica bacterium]|nr:hypothetical protein [Candidatus Omnitrophota bacterium]